MISTFTCQLVRTLCGVSPRWLHPPVVDGPAVYFANHTSHLDAVAIYASLPKALRRRTHPVAAQDYWDTTPLRRFLATRVLQAVLIERHDARKALASLKRLTALLAQGEALIIFPEGTRNESTDPQPFKSGLFRLWRQCPDVPFIPVYLENLNRVLPKGEILPVPLLGSVTFGTPVNYPPGTSRNDFLERSQHALGEMKTP
jgi:1-acyl-sn-glycerol-3-phosphate acyltransferase